MEYATFIAVVAAALIAMSVYVRRSIQAQLKSIEDRINTEALTDAPVGLPGQPGPPANPPPDLAELPPSPGPGPGPGPSPLWGSNK